MEVGINVNLHNKFEFEVRDAVTNELKQSAVAHNIILDSMYDRLIGRNQFMQYIHVGTGDIDEDDLDPTATSLHTSVIRRATILDSNSTYLDNLFRRVKIQIEPGEYVGSKFSEVGLGSSTSASSLLTHALITDSAGNPIVIEKTALDVLIIYATVYFTIGNLPSHVKLANISSNGNIYFNSTYNNNILIYLVTGGTTTKLETAIRLGTYGDSLNTRIGTPLRGLELDKKATSLTTNLSERKIIFPVRRFEINEGNGDVQEVCFGDSFNVSLPNSNYMGTQYNDVPLQSHNGNNLIYMLPSRKIDKNTIEIKKNNVLTTAEIIDIPYYAGYNPSFFTEFYFLNFASNNKAFAMSTGQLHLFEKTTEWRQTHTYNLPVLKSLSADYLAHITPYGANYLIMHSYNRLGLYSLEQDDWIHNDFILPRKYSLDRHGIVQINDNLFMCIAYRSVAGGGPRENWQLVYIPSEDITTWETIQSFSESQKAIGIASNKNIFGMASKSSAVTWYRFDESTKTLNTIDIIGQTAHRQFCVNPLEDIIVAFSGAEGIASYHENTNLEWEYDNLITDETNIIYTHGWFVDDNTLIMWNLYNCSLWKKISNVWEQVLVGIDRTRIIQKIYYSEISMNYSKTIFTPNKTTYTEQRGSVSNTSTAAMMMNVEGSYAIKFDTPPLATDEITASYKVNGIHKTDQYVLDVGAYIQFGEG